VRLILVLDAIAIICIVVALIIDSTKQSIITFNVVPADSQISLNGKSGYSNGSYRLVPGIYNVEISHEGLDTKKFKVDLEKDDISAIITFLHQGENFDFYTLRDNIGDYLSLAEIASAGYNQTTDQDISAEGFITEFQKNYDLYSAQLPIEYRESEGYGANLSILKNITIRADYDCDVTLCVEALMVGTDSRGFVNSLLQEKGFNVEDFEIEYKIY
jgi:hypothetical protein